MRSAMARVQVFLLRHENLLCIETGITARCRVFTLLTNDPTWSRPVHTKLFDGEGAACLAWQRKP